MNILNKLVFKNLKLNLKKWLVFLFQENLHFEKSISGCDFINPDNISYFFNSSEVGLPIYFYLISNIIFSTVPLVSPSKSLKFDGSDDIFFVSIFSSPFKHESHQCQSVPHFANVKLIYFSPCRSVSNVHNESSTLIFSVKS